MPRPRKVRWLVVLTVLGLTLGLAGGATFAAFSASTSTSATFSAASDWVAPNGSSVIAGTAAGAPVGTIGADASYYVYAMLTDFGNPPSGVAAATADVSGITVGQTAVPLSAGSFSAGGVSYNFRSGSLTSDAGLTDGTIPYSLSVTDVNGNTGSLTGFSVTIDVSAPSGADVQTANGGATAGRPETGDQVVYTFSEPMDPNSILAGWTGGSTAVVVNFGNGCGSKQLTVTSGATTVALGTVCLGANYTNGNRTANATMSMSGSIVTVTLASNPAQANTVATPTTMTWTPSAAAMDVSGNPCSTAAVTETGGADVEF